MRYAGPDLLLKNQGLTDEILRTFLNMLETWLCILGARGASPGDVAHPVDHFVATGYFKEIFTPSSEIAESTVHIGEGFVGQSRSS